MSVGTTAAIAIGVGIIADAIAVQVAEQTGVEVVQLHSAKGGASHGVEEDVAGHRAAV